MTIYKKLDKKHTAVLELINPIKDRPKICLVNRIQIPVEYNGKGIKETLMKMLCDVADIDMLVIYYHIQDEKKIAKEKFWLGKFAFFKADKPDLMVRIPPNFLFHLSAEEVFQIRDYIERDD